MLSRALCTAIYGMMFFVNTTSAQDMATESDIRCALVGFRMEQSDNPLMRQSGLMATMYFIGRLDGRNPKLNLEKALTAVLLKTSNESAEEFRATATRCGGILQARGADITTIGGHLIERGKRMMEMENSR